MKIQKVSGKCLGALRLCAIDVGFDLRRPDQPIALPLDWPEWLQTPGPIAESGVGFDSHDGRAIVWGSRDEVVQVLQEAGYCIDDGHDA